MGNDFLRNKITSLSDEDLLLMVNEKAEDYTTIALKIAILEIESRGLKSKIITSDEITRVLKIIKDERNSTSSNSKKGSKDIKGSGYTQTYSKNKEKGCDDMGKIKDKLMKNGIILILIGLFLPILLYLFLGRGYIPQNDLFYNVTENMYLVVGQQKVTPSKNVFISPLDNGIVDITLPFKYIFGVGLVLTIAGVGILVADKSKKVN